MDLTSHRTKTRLEQVWDVAFCTKFMTAGTRYGAQPKGKLVPITHNPGVNCAHRMANLREVGFFEDGCIGAEDVVLDAKIQRADTSCSSTQRTLCLATQAIQALHEADEKLRLPRMVEISAGLKSQNGRIQQLDSSRGL